MVTPSFAVRVLDQQVIDLESHKITFNRIETPVLKPEVAIPARQAAPTAPSPAELARLREREKKAHLFVDLSGTVDSRGFSRLRWRREDGEYLILSNVNFHHFGNLLEVETNNAIYSLMTMLEDDSGETVTKRESLPQSDGAGTFRILSAPTSGVSPEVTSALVAMHRHYDANRRRLLAEYTEREARGVAEERRLRQNPPQPKDTVINYFPIRSGKQLPNPTETPK